ncbi:H(+)/Cl(-) exchange transporter ClcA [Ancylobacter sp. G4_0304]|uniref:H(+)/Cl(-) exchange transporter ClcA n=1 Tax=Ancylobacter sp. G4_0304 TaxID=3114289 RepID=UPI0039C74141
MSNLAYYIVAILVGSVVGVVGTGFHLGVEAALDWPAVLRERSGLEGYYLLAAGAGIAALCTVTAVWLVRRFAPEAAGSGVQEIEGAMAGMRVVRWHRVLPVKFVGGLLALGSGLVAGREGPTIHMGASIAKAAADWQRLSGADMHGLLAAGGAAGLAAAFNAPLAAILFVIEETRRQFPYSGRTYAAVGLACVMSGIVTTALSGAEPYMLMPVAEVALVQLPVFAVMGLILGVAGVVFNTVLIWSLDHARRFGLRTSFYLLPALVGLAIGALMFLRPEATQGGELLAVQLTKENLPLAVLAFIVMIRFVMTMASYSAGAPGGIFAPILALATTIGLVYGSALDMVMPLPDGMAAALAVAAMGGLFASTIGAPLVGMVLVAELTGAYTVLLPVIVTTLVANIVAQALGGRPIYEVLLERTLALEAQSQGMAEAASGVPPTQS